MEIEKDTIHQVEIKNLLQNLNKAQNQINKISIPTREGFHFVDISGIIRCESDINYTSLYLTDGTKIVSCKTLREYDEMLSDFNFLRVHKSHLVNLSYIRSYAKGEGGIITMTDNSVVEVSRRNKELFFIKMGLKSL